MQFFIWVAFLVVICIAIFAVQNSTTPAVLMRFLFWRFETSLIYVILGSIGLGVFLTLFICIPRAVRTAIQMKKLRRGLEDSEPRQRESAPPGQEPK